MEDDDTIMKEVKLEETKRKEKKAERRKTKIKEIREWKKTFSIFFFVSHSNNSAANF